MRLPHLREDPLKHVLPGVHVGGTSGGILSTTIKGILSCQGIDILFVFHTLSLTLQVFNFNVECRCFLGVWTKGLHIVTVTVAAWTTNSIKPMPSC